jgi:hypothetical protein
MSRSTAIPTASFSKGDTVHSVSMKVHFTAAVGLNEPITAIGKKAHNASPRTRARLLHDPTALDTVVLHFPPYSIQHRIHCVIKRLSSFAGTQGLPSQSQDDACLIGSLDMMSSFVTFHRIMWWSVSSLSESRLRCGFGH